MLQPDTVLFDLDGTLLDTAPDFIVVLNALRAKFGHPPLSENIIRNTVSNGARALVSLGFAVQEGDPDFEKYRQQLLDLYQEQLGHSTRLFPGMDQLLTQLEKQRIPWGIVTNKPQRFTIPLLVAVSLHQRCSVVVCADQVIHPKPHPESLIKACQAVNALPENSIYVGDHQRDIEAGQRANMHTIVALFGYIPDNENPYSWRASFQAHSAEDITHYIFGE